MELWSLLQYFFLTISFLKLVYSLVGISKKNTNLPPGPVPLPVIGNLLKMGSKPHISLAELAKTYGPIMSLKLGQVTAVVISSPAIAKEVLQKQDLAFANRYVSNSLHAHDHHKYSMSFLPVGDRWRSLRKILNSNIFASSRLDRQKDLRRKKVEELVSFVKKRSRDGAAVDVGCAAFMTSINLLSNTLFSVDLTDPNEESASKDFKDLVWNILEEAGKPNFADFFPFLTMFDPQGTRKRQTLHFRKVFDAFVKMIDERSDLRTTSGTKPENDVLDILLGISEKDSDQMDRPHMLHLFLDLFIAGADTTSSTVEWMMCELLRNPNALAKAKAELEEVVGKGNIVKEEDVARLPYLRAIIRENWRLHAPVPLLLPRMVITDVEICGYTVPKGAQVWVNAWAIGRDPEVWPNPTCFTPERFLDSDVDVRGTDFELIPFGAGRRICPGLPLVMRMVPIVVGSLINSFDWKLDGGMAPEEIDMEDKFGLTLAKAQPLLAVPISTV